MTVDSVISCAIPSSQEQILDRLPGKLSQAKIPDDTDLEKVTSTILCAFPSLTENDFVDDAIWRDSYALTGTLRTFYFRRKIVKIWETLVTQHGAQHFRLVQNSARITRIDLNTAWIDVRFEFSTSNTLQKCSGFLSLVPSHEEGWKIWVLRTILENVTGCGDVDCLSPASEPLNGFRAEHNGVGKFTHFQAVVLGGGQSGLCTAGRLKALGVTYVVLDKNNQVGDAWALRYDSAKLHTIRDTAQMPFERLFGPECGEFLSKNTLAEGHRQWAKKYDIKLNAWLSSTIESGSWEEDKKIWTLTVSTRGTSFQITANHVVFATGAGSQTPAVPEIADKDKFRGVSIHSADYKSAQAWRGLAGIVVGSANTAHDVAADMLESGMTVMMVQRSRTYVLPVEYLKSRHQAMYNSLVPIELADRIILSGPLSISRLLSSKTLHLMARAQPERWEALERAGFRVDPYGDVQNAISGRLGGHYIDVGTSDKIAKGLIKVKSGASPVRCTEQGLVFDDGEEVAADVVVFATGFVGNLRLHVEQILGKEVAERAHDCFGFDDEGEIKGAFRPMPQPGLWYIGGGSTHSRYFSRFIALSIKADIMGRPLQIYSADQHRPNGEHIAETGVIRPKGL